MQFEKPKLFPNLQSFWWIAVLLFLCILLRLGVLYREYEAFRDKPFYYTHATVLSQSVKSKNHRRYTVLKLRSDEGMVFYTTTYKKDTLLAKRLRIQMFPGEYITYWDYLGTFYVKSRIKKSEPVSRSVKNRLLQKVASQHEEGQTASLYNAIFFATPLEKSLREKINMLGISHLVALSGFHLGILWGLVYGSLLIGYKPLQQRFFPYRHALFDIGVLAMSVLGLYVWFVDFPPSLIRAYAMVFAGWLMLLCGVELLSFTFLATIGLLLIALFPSLLVSIGFWLSVSGVFYIYLLLHYTNRLNKWVVTLVVIPLGVFVLMLPVIHAIFGTTTTYQLLSPLLSLLFVPFYPLMILLHLFDIGATLDKELMWLFNLPKGSYDAELPIPLLVLYLIFSFAAIRYKRMFYVTVLIAFLYACYLFLALDAFDLFLPVEEHAKLQTMQKYSPGKIDP